MALSIAQDGQFFRVFEGRAAGLRAQFLSVSLVLVAGLSAILLGNALSGTDIVLVFVPTILVIALLCDLPAALCGGLASAVCYNVLFLPPLYTFTPKDPRNMLVVAVFMTEALVVSLIADRLRAAAARAVALDKVAERERLQAAMLASISHDLRTPLAAILGSASSLKLCAGALDEDAARSLLETILEEAASLNRFIGNLLDMTRLEAGMVARADQVDVADVCDSALRRLEPCLPAARVALRLAPNLPEALADAVLLEQVLFNLLDNAAKYARPGARVEIAAWPADQLVHLSVVSEGSVLPEDQLERIFDKFHRAAGAGGPAGTGLGLPICRGFVEAMGGRIQARNRPGGGAAFTLTLPAARQPSPP